MKQVRHWLRIFSDALATFTLEPGRPPEAILKISDSFQYTSDATQIANQRSLLEAMRESKKRYRKEIFIGQIVMFCLIFFAIIISVIFAYLGKTWVACIFGGSTLISVVNAMLNAKGKKY